MVEEMPLYESLLSLERKVCSPEVRRSRELCEPLFAEDFVEFGSIGVVYDKASIIEALVTGKPFDGEFVIEDFEAKELADGLVLVTYRLKAIATGGAVTAISLRSTIYRQSGAIWQQVFHQATKVVVT
jgi:hypothetical protein